MTLANMMGLCIYYFYKMVCYLINSTTKIKTALRTKLKKRTRNTDILKKLQLLLTNFEVKIYKLLFSNCLRILRFNFCVSLPRSSRLHLQNKFNIISRQDHFFDKDDQFLPSLLNIFYLLYLKDAFWL